MNSYERIYEALINEVGDTAKGREKIRQAIHNRRVDLDVASSVAKDNPEGFHGQSLYNLMKNARGEQQMRKAQAYLKGKESGGHKGAMKAFRAAKKKYAKRVASLERRVPNVPDVYKGTLGEPTGAGVRSAIRNMTYRNRQLRRKHGE